MYLEDKNIVLSKFFLLLLTFSFIIGQLIRLEILDVQFPLLDAAVFLFVAYHILARQFSWGKYFAQKWLLMFIGALILSDVVNLPRYSLVENVTGVLYLARFLIYSLVIGVQMQEQTRRSLLTEKKIRWIGLIIAVIGILQFIFYPSFEYLKYSGWDEHLNRLAFPYLDPSFTGVILLLFVIINLCGQTRRSASTQRGESVSTKIITFLELIAIFLTFSRATWITCTIILFMIAFKRKNVKIIGGIVFLVTVAVVVIFFGKPISYGNQLFRTETILSRLGSSRKAINIWQKNPIIGVGFNHYKQYLIKSMDDKKMIKKYEDSHGLASAENSFVFVMATGGVVALIFFGFWIRSLLRTKNELGLYIIISILIGSLFNNVIFYPFILLIIFFTVTSQQE